ncbi:MAG: hybrid sensor histidine kinase/response regulator, partial [Paludibacter sp.]|nr:hybrid sensor histidine kinase/response regulator [Paludibacter sp.]
MFVAIKSSHVLAFTFNPIIQIVLFLSSLFVISPLFAQTDNYRAFDNILLSSEASKINCFIQDRHGLVWFGSNKGLFSYNGYNVQHHFHPYSENNIEANQIINCGIMIDSNLIYLGSDNGVMIYNTETYSFKKNDLTFPSDVRSMELSGDFLWIGTLNGLYCYDLIKKKLHNYSESLGLPHQAIFSILNSKQNNLYVGTYNGLSYLPKGSNNFNKINLPAQLNQNRLLVMSLLEDSIRNCIWIGTEGHLFKLSLSTGNVERIKAFDNNSIKSLALDQYHNLLLGTDNGLYVYNKENGLVRQVVHDSRYSKSLTNNIIWSILTDKNKNVWFGTDYGVSLHKNNKDYRFVHISELTGIGDGNQFQVIYKDSKGNFWYGGNNGLIFSAAGSKKCIWYKMGDIRFPISHNRIRYIYEDNDKNLWVATDGSINRYDYKTKQFIHYNIVDSTFTRNANWAYSIFEDHNGRLWIGTYLGGIFVVNKKKLINSTSYHYVAEQNFNNNESTNGLSENYILQIAPDLQGNVWALTYTNGVNKINISTGVVTKFPSREKSTIENCFSLIRDKEGYIWVGNSGSLSRIDPITNAVQIIRLEGIEDIPIRLLTEENNHIWITTSAGIFVLDKKTLRSNYLGFANKSFSCSFFDSDKNDIYMGGVDGFAVFPSSIYKEKKTNPQIVLTALYINDRFVQAGIDYKGKSALFTDDISLRHDQNNLTFEFSDLKYAQENDQKYVYKLSGIDQEWRNVKPNSNRITYNNLAPGKYRLTIGNYGTEGKTVFPAFNLQITIKPPWYYSIWAKAIYGILIIGLLLWIINYYRV